MDTKKVIYTTGGIVLVFLLLFITYQLLGVGADPKVLLQVSEKKPLYRVGWNSKSTHVLTVFSDYQCPACKTYDEFLTSFESTKSAHYPLTKKTALVFRHFPLYTIHQHATQLAYAAEAAGKQGKFFEMSRLLFTKQEQIQNESNIDLFVFSLADSLQLDRKQFEADYRSKDILALVSFDMQLGNKVSVPGTPTFFLDGKKLEIRSPDDLVTTLQKL